MSDVFDHPWLGGLFGDDAAAAIWSPEQSLAHMLAFEAAWSRALGATGRVPQDMAERAATAVETWTPDHATLRDGTGTDGLPVPALSKALKSAAGDDAKAIHSGATSQDVMDSALALTLRATSDLLDTRLAALDTALADLTERFGETEIMGRTRMQDALPIRAGQRIGQWAQPIPRHRDRLAALRPRTEVVQVGGAVGDLQATGEDGPAIRAHVAQALGLADAPSWHTARDGVAEYAALLSLMAGSCGKMGQDIALMAQAGEIGIAGGGGSSAMPHKQNPIRAELLVTLARYAAGQAGLVTQTMIAEQERSGMAWALEWMALPPLARATLRAVDVAASLIRDVERIGPA